MHLDLTAKEKQKYSVTRLVAAALTPNPRAAAPFEFSCDDAIRAKAGPSTYGGIALPDDLLFNRALVVGTGSMGGNLVGTAVPSFQAAVRETSWLEKVGVQRWPNLEQSQAVPRHTSNVTATWLTDEVTPATPATPNLGSVPLAPKNVCIVVQRSRQHLLQGPQQDEQLLRELGLSLGYTVAVGAAQGSGTGGEPTGALLQVTQNNSGTALSAAGIAEMIRLCEVAGAGENLTALTGPAAAKIFRTRERATGSGFLLQGGRLLDVPCIVTNTMPTDALLIGDFGQSIFASWGPTIEIVVTNKASRTAFMTATVSIRAISSVDFGVVHPTAFAKSTSIT